MQKFSWFKVFFVLENMEKINSPATTTESEQKPVAESEVSIFNKQNDDDECKRVFFFSFLFKFN